MSFKEDASTSECRICAANAKQVGEKNNFIIYQCHACSFVFATIPVMGFDPMAEYRDYGGNQKYLEKKDKKLKRSGKRIKRCKNLVSRYRFLEIGCNVGIATESARRLGFDAVGIDVDTTAIDIAKREFPECQFFAELSTDYVTRGAKHDVIYCSEVIEHVPDPISVLKSMKDLLAGGGVVWMSTPDSGHWRTPKNIIEWKELQPPDHIGMFNRKSLETALAKVDLRILKQEFNMKWGLKVLVIHA